MFSSYFNAVDNKGDFISKSQMMCKNILHFCLSFSLIIFYSFHLKQKYFPSVSVMWLLLNNLLTFPFEETFKLVFFLLDCFGMLCFVSFVSCSFVWCVCIVVVEHNRKWCVPAGARCFCLLVKRDLEKYLGSK